MSLGSEVCERVRELLNYYEDTGVFTWKVSPRKGVPVGSLAGSYHGGSIKIWIDGEQYTAQRLAWLYAHGEFPPCRVVHIGSKVDNALSNLRLIGENYESN